MNIDIILILGLLVGFGPGFGLGIFFIKVDLGLGLVPNLLLNLGLFPNFLLNLGKNK